MKHNHTYDDYHSTELYPHCTSLDLPNVFPRNTIFQEKRDVRTQAKPSQSKSMASSIQHNTMQHANCIINPIT